MTIDSTWLRAFKEEAREAFTKHAPFRPNAVFTDGQIRLMQGGAKGLMTWDEYVRRQFLIPIRRFFETAGTVVLAFDCYAYVPQAKAMTQAKRRRHVPPLEFGERSCLPPLVPTGEAWTTAISNRTFKAKIIEYVLLSLPNQLLRDNPGKRLIVDYSDPVSYAWNPETNVVDCTLLEGLKPLGEADIKFTRYADLFERLLVDSIDGDSVPIALIHHERCLAQGLNPPRVCIYRMTIRDKPEPEPKPAGKRKKPEKKPEKKPAAKREYEFLDILALYQALRTVVLQSIGRTHLPMHAGHEIRMLTALICLTSTDFSRNLPQLSGKTLYEMIPRIWMTLVMVYDPATDQLRTGAGEAADRLVALIYHEKFGNHAPSRRGLAGVLAELRGSGLSQRLKDSLPTEARVESTVRNANWVLRYWRCEECPDPVSEEFGYRRDAKGVTHYLDA